MPCNQNCNQGRNCNCNRASDRAVVIIATLMLIAITAFGWGVYKLIKGNTGSPCAVEVQYSGGVKATYIGSSV